MTDEIQLGQAYRSKINGVVGVCTAIVDHITGCRRYGLRPIAPAPQQTHRDEAYYYGDELARVTESDVDEFDVVTVDDQDPVTDVDLTLGVQARDTVSGLDGVVTAIGYELYNCPRAAVTLRDGEQGEVEWFDVPRLTQINDGVSDEFSKLVESEETSQTGAATVDFQHKSDAR